MNILTPPPSTSGSSLSLPVGTVMPAAVSDGGTWQACDGTVLTQASYATLFARLGHKPMFTWTLIPPTSFTPAAVGALIYGGGVYVAYGRGGYVWTSTDLVTWTARTSGVSVNLLAGAYGNGTFVLVGETSTVIVSTNGITWTTKSIGSVGNCRYIDYLNSRFVGATATGYVFYSADGVTWSATAQLSAAMTATAIGYYTQGIWWMFAPGATAAGHFWSSDGSTWAFTAKPTANSLMWAGFDANYTYAIESDSSGAGDTGGDMHRSANGSTWTKFKTNYIPGHSVATGGTGISDGQGLVGLSFIRGYIWSIDGWATYTIAELAWSVANPNPVGWSEILNSGMSAQQQKYQGLGNKFFVHCSASNAVFYSVDGKKWIMGQNRPGYHPFMGAVSVPANVGHKHYWNGKYFYTAANAANSAGNKGIYYTSDPYDPATQFQIPIETNSDGTYRYIKVA